MSSLSKNDLMAEFDHQLNTLIEKGYPRMATMSDIDFKKHVEPLKEKLHSGRTLHELSLDNGYIPFVIVINSNTVAVDAAISTVDFNGKKPVIAMTPYTPEQFKPIESVDIPTGAAYLLLDIDRGRETLNIAPEEALKSIVSQHRSPLTIDEGIAIITHHPEFLKKNNCFSLLASRGDNRCVPAIWISENRPKLGWCWNGNPHTWLGSASCLHRIGIN